MMATEKNLSINLAGILLLRLRRKKYNLIILLASQKNSLSVEVSYFSSFKVHKTVVNHLKHKVRIYKEYQSVCPLVGIGTLPTPLSPASVPLPPEPGGGAHSPAGEGLGEYQFLRLAKKLSTKPTL